MDGSSVSLKNHLNISDYMQHYWVSDLPQIWCGLLSLSCTRSCSVIRSRDLCAPVYYNVSIMTHNGAKCFNIPFTEIAYRVQ